MRKRLIAHERLDCGVIGWPKETEEIAMPAIKSQTRRRREAMKNATMSMNLTGLGMGTMMATRCVKIWQILCVQYRFIGYSL
jgi:hypothetical protein